MERHVSRGDAAGEGGRLWPTELKVAEKGTVLKVSFEDGARFVLTAEFLRVMSPSAEVRGHGAAERKIVGGKRNVVIIGVDPVGTYAVRLSFDDMHQTGLYTWSYLRQLGEGHDELWNSYVAALAAHGLDRDRPGEAQAAP